MDDNPKTNAVRSVPNVGGSFTLAELEALSGRIAEVGEPAALAEVEAARKAQAVAAPAPAEVPAQADDAPAA
jgi:hypothetical protein